MSATINIHRWGSELNTSYKSKSSGSFFVLMKSFTGKIFETISSLDSVSSFQVMGLHAFYSISVFLMLHSSVIWAVWLYIISWMDTKTSSNSIRGWWTANCVTVTIYISSRDFKVFLRISNIHLKICKYESPRLSTSYGCAAESHWMAVGDKPCKPRSFHNY